jgi:hypothetical protein
MELSIQRPKRSSSKRAGSPASSTFCAAYSPTSSAIAVNCSSAACKSSMISPARISGLGRLAVSSSDSSRSQKMSRLTLSRARLHNPAALGQQRIDILTGGRGKESRPALFARPGGVRIVACDLTLPVFRNWTLLKIQQPRRASRSHKARVVVWHRSLNHLAVVGERYHAR